MTAYVQDSQFFTRRGLVVVAILMLHLFIIWAIATGLARRAIEAIAPPIQVNIMPEVQKDTPPPPPPPPDLVKQQVEIPPPDVTIDLPVAPAQQTTAISNTTTQHVVAAPPPPKPGVKVAARPAKNFPNSEDYYPAASKRLNEEGAPVVHVCVGADGKLTEAPTVAQSSGSARLDEGAVNLAKAGRYVTGTEDGKPIKDCFNFRVKFQMTK